MTDRPPRRTPGENHRARHRHDKWHGETPSTRTHQQPSSDYRPTARPPRAPGESLPLPKPTLKSRVRVPSACVCGFATMARLVALLRGINLGAKRRVPMADLRELMDELGYTDVRTVLQSGNVVFTGTKATRAQKLQKALEERFGFEIDVVMRTMAELQSDRRPRPVRATRPTTPSATSSSSSTGKPDTPAASTARTGARTACTPTARALRLVPRRHAEQQADEGARQARDRRHGDLPQHGHGQEAAGLSSRSGATPSRSSSRRPSGSSSAARTQMIELRACPRRAVSRACSAGCSPLGTGALIAGGAKLRRAASTSSAARPRRSPAAGACCRC